MQQEYVPYDESNELNFDFPSQTKFQPMKGDQPKYQIK